MRKLIAAAFALLLPGCWLGDGLYSATDARPALPPGLYRLVFEGEEESETARVSIMADGMTRIEGTRDAAIIGFVPLDAEGRRFAQWNEVADRLPRPGFSEFYLLVERRPGGEYVFYYPTCEDEEREVARSAGATVEPTPNIAICRFSSRASLETALRRLRPDSAHVVYRLVRIGEGRE